MSASPASNAIRRSFKQRMALAFLPPLFAAAIRLLGCTLRHQEIGPPGSRPEKNPSTRVYALWHRSLLGVAYYFRTRGIAILISSSFDGELIARTVRYVGYTAARGSSSRSGVAGLLGMKRALAQTNYAAFTVDGPRGPQYIAKPGAIKLAQQVGGGVGIFYAHPQRYWQLRSWDRFIIPKPFSRVVVSWQPPVPVDASANDNQLEAARLAVQQSLERARLAAEQHFASHRPIQQQ